METVSRLQNGTSSDGVDHGLQEGAGVVSVSSFIEVPTKQVAKLCEDTLKDITEYRSELHEQLTKYRDGLNFFMRFWLARSIWYEMEKASVRHYEFEELATELLGVARLEIADVMYLDVSDLFNISHKIPR